MNKRILTGVKPTGTFHLGNYASVIKPIEQLKKDLECSCYIFIADTHSLTKYQPPEILSNNIKQIYAVLHSFFGNDINVFIYRQSQIKSIFKLYYILNCFCNKGFLDRNHTFKATAEDNVNNNRDPNYGVNVGMYTYPTLMAADILIFEPDFVPVGIDQEQHMEITRYIARKINSTYEKDLFKIPQSIHYKEETLVGTDGRKMSKSYNNIIPLFNENEKKLRKTIFSIATNSKNVGEPKYEGESAVTDILKFLMSENDYKALLSDMEKGLGWGEVKGIAFELIRSITKNKLEIYNEILNNDLIEKDDLSVVLNEQADEKIKEIQDVIGVL